MHLFRAATRNFRRVHAYLTLTMSALGAVSYIAKDGDVVALEFSKLSLLLAKGGASMRFPFSYVSDAEPVFMVRVFPKGEHMPAAWSSVFSSPFLQILEKRNAVALKPLRWGFNSEEQMQLLRLARQAIEKDLAGTMSQTDAEIPGRFTLPVGVDVVLWIDGEMRGSQISDGVPLHRAIARAAVRAAHDPRFKPVVREELGSMRIEVIIFSETRIPLTDADLDAGRIYPEKGYVFQNDGKTGWYLPSVHTTVRFGNLQRFLAALATKKAKVESLPRPGEVSIFETDSFVETHDRRLALALTGPVPTPMAVSDGHAWCARAAEWLCSLQEPDGSMPAVIGARTGKVVQQVSWARFAFCACALAEYGKAAKHERGISAARRAYEHLLRNHFGAEPHQKVSALVLSYAIKLKDALGMDVESEIARLLELREDFSNASKLDITHIAEALLLGRGSEQAHAESRRLQTILRERFEEEKKSPAFNCVAWAESAVLFKDIDPTLSLAILDAVAACQLPSGGFAETKGGYLPYTRGAGKIYEVLALEPERYEAELTRLRAWLISMQYTKDSAYFIPPTMFPRIEGSFRHDALNTDAWIDAAGHCVFAESRLISAVLHTNER